MLTRSYCQGFLLRFFENEESGGLSQKRINSAIYMQFYFMLVL